MKAVFLPHYPRPLVFAHRGLSWLYPENSMAAFRAAKKAGIPGIELDIHLSRDRRLVVFHDDTTQRIVTGAKGEPGPNNGPAGESVSGISVHRESLSIEASDYESLAGLDIGSWKDPSFASERMPLLDTVLEELGGEVYFDIEIKSRSVKDSGQEVLLADLLRRHCMEGRCIVSSFNPLSLRRFKALMPELPTAIIWSRSKELYWYLRRGEGRWIAGADLLKPEHCLVGGRRILKGLRRPILPWTVDTAEDEKRLLAAGVEGIISNRPQDLSGWKEAHTAHG
ncbi:MAG: glycerophosphodiester phosphodiesterase family protein [Spirochaetia bacterium]|jgi:glycerophosphoryl diester phosphodiesterase|nr:glycerophosphodiester phosphodiesterase family protein [Spirochaetia bacterium]